MSDIKSTLRTPTSSNAFLNYLLTTDLKPNLHRPCLNAVVSFQQTDSVSYVFKRLSDDGILSAPVMDGNRYVGFITLFDIMCYITNMYWGVTGEEWTTFFDNADDFAFATVEEVMDAPTWRGRQYVEPLYTHNTTLHCLEKLAITKAHRAAVLDSSTNRVMNIMTQSMLISEIRQRISMLGSLRHKTVVQMQDSWTVVRTIRECDRAINAFKQMRDSNISGLAVVDDDGVLTGSISVRDLRGIGSDGPWFSRLFQTVKEFKDTAAKEYPFLGARNHFYIGSTPAKGLVCTPTATFESIINMMADGCVHRIFICSEESIQNGRPIPTNVLTQTDILTVVFRHFAMPAASWEVAGRG
jgi:CBS domain-containing protein